MSARHRGEGLATPDDDPSQPPDAAVRCGRLVFFFAGGVTVAVPAALAIGGVPIDSGIDWLVAGAGVALIILGATLPPRIVADVGLHLPLFLPDLD